MVYVSSQHPNLELRSEADLRQAISNELLEENHFLEFKKKIESGKKGNEELARDLAQFAIDGGTLIVGISERGDVLELEPVELRGLKERIEQVARSRIDPPLPIDIRVIRGSDPQKGYLVVVVPPSAMAPHMVDGRYWARGNATKYMMSDVEVWRLHERRRPIKQDIDALLEREIRRDPVPNGKFGHLFLVATPHPEREGLLAELVTETGWAARLDELANRSWKRVSEQLPDLARQVAPPFRRATRRYLRLGGVALSSPYLTQDREPSFEGHEHREQELFDLEVSEDGLIRIFSAVTRLYPDDDSQVIWDYFLVAITRQFLALLETVSEDVGYFGPWGLGIAGTGLRGKTAGPSSSDSLFFPPSSVSNEDTYQRVTMVSALELRQRPGAVTERLVGQLLRALGCSERHKEALIDPDVDGKELVSSSDEVSGE